MVLDGAVDANLSLAADAAAEAPAIQGAVEHELAACAATAGCPLGSDPVAPTWACASDCPGRPSPLPATGTPCR